MKKIVYGVALLILFLFLFFVLVLLFKKPSTANSGHADCRLAIKNNTNHDIIIKVEYGDISSNPYKNIDMEQSSLFPDKFDGKLKSIKDIQIDLKAETYSFKMNSNDKVFFPPAFQNCLRSRKGQEPKIYILDTNGETKKTTDCGVIWSSIIRKCGSSSGKRQDAIIHITDEFFSGVQQEIK